MVHMCVLPCAVEVLLASRPASRGAAAAHEPTTREPFEAGRPGTAAITVTPVPDREAPRRKRDGDATRARILDAAIGEFAAKGFIGARIEEICRNAKANPRMIYRYFGDKEGLYVAVLESVLRELRTEELKLEVDHVEPFDGMLLLFQFIHDHFGRHPELIALLSGENLLRARFLRESVTTPIAASPLIELIDSLLRRGEATGAFRAGIDPLVLYVTMVALSYFHRSNVHTLSAIFRKDLSASTWQSLQRRSAEEMISRFLLPDPR
jgi:AcrR family transcriptional regulator